jgi:hypothetical protein
MGYQHKPTELCSSKQNKPITSKSMPASINKQTTQTQSEKWAGLHHEFINKRT